MALSMYKRISFISLRMEGLRYKPDLVLAYVPHYGGNRHMYTKKFGADNPLFKRIEGRLVLTNSPLEDPSMNFNFVRKTHWWYVNHIRTYKILRDRLLYLVNQGTEEVKKQKEKKNQDDDKNSEDDEFMEESYAVGDELIYTMHKESIKNGVTFVLVTNMTRLHGVALQNKCFPLTFPLLCATAGLL